MAKITLKNISSATVVIGSTNGNIRSRSLAPNRVITLLQEVLLAHASC